MIYIIIFFFIVIFAIKLYGKKFNSEYTLNLLFGQKGSGKTTLCAKLILHYQAKGYTCYTDIEGINIPGVRIFNIRDLAKYKPVENSAIFLDEIGLTQNNRDFKSFDAGLREFYAKQRHFRCVVWANSQSVDCDKFIRLRCNNLFYCQKIFGFLSLARPIVQVMQPNDMSSPNTDSPLIQYYKWGKIPGWKFTLIPRYCHLFNSFAVPDLPEVPYEGIPGKPISSKKEARILLKTLNKKGKK